jgi:hypothetical protein
MVRAETLETTIITVAVQISLAQLFEIGQRAASEDLQDQILTELHYNTLGSRLFLGMAEQASEDGFCVVHQKLPHEPCPDWEEISD